MTVASHGGDRSLLAAPIDPFTYRTLIYLAFAGPIGLAYLVLFSVGVGLSLGLVITPIGPLVLVGTLIGVVSLAWVDGHFTDGLLGVDLSPDFPDTEQDLVSFLRELFVGRATWTGAAFLLWRTLLGFLAFVLLVTGASITFALLLAPFTYDSTLVVQYSLGTIPIDTFGRSLLAAGFGVLTGIGTLYGANVLGRATVLVAKALLGDQPEDASEPEGDSGGPGNASDSRTEHSAAGAGAQRAGRRENLD